jgi:2-polyprenyl-3-methyl-5-hydroxy-6-metoxy-1,4-benzoquinol methylase
MLPGSVRFDVVDVSPSSLELVKGIANSGRIQYHLCDICEFEPPSRYDFITMGEVLEHLEEPLTLLGRIRNLISDTGHAYITTPVNSPSLDHIYLFHDVEEIRSMLKRAGFRIEREITRYAEDMPEDRAKKLKIAQMFGAFVVPD